MMSTALLPQDASTTVGDSHPFEDMVTRIDARLARKTGRVIAFMAGNRGEGTSTLARRYVATAATQMQRNVLLLNTVAESTAGVDFLQALLDRQDMQDRQGMLESLPGGGRSIAVGTGHAPLSFWSLLSHNGLWEALRSQFDEVVLDMPALATSRMGLGVAAQCDGVVVVVEAEKSRAPVAQHLVSSLQAVCAPILGSVLNRRRLYVPHRIYDRL